MSKIRISRQALMEVEQAFNQYEEVLAELEESSTIRPSTQETYLVHSKNFVRWLSGEFDPGARNRA